MKSIFFPSCNFNLYSAPTNNSEWMTFTHSLRSDSELICNAVSTTAYATVHVQDGTFTEALEPRVEHSGLLKSPQCKNINNTRDRKNRHWPSITDVNMAIRQNASAPGNPAGVSGGGQRAATQIRMSKSSRWGELEEGLSLISAIVFLTQRPVGRGSLTKPACVDKTMLILTCLNVTQLLSGGVLEKEVGGVGVWMLREELQGSFTASCHTSSLHPPRYNPSPCPLIGRLIILSQR